MTNHQNAGRTAGGTSKKRRSDDARASTRRGEAVNKKDPGRTKKRKDGPSKGAGNAVGGNINDTSDSRPNTIPKKKRRKNRKGKKGMKRWKESK